MLSRLSLQVLVMVHELSNPAEYSDYLARVLAPATPLMVLGRSRAAHPVIPGEQAMWYAWKDRSASLLYSSFH